MYVSPRVWSKLLSLCINKSHMKEHFVYHTINVIRIIAVIIVLIEYVKM